MFPSGMGLCNAHSATAPPVSYCMSSGLHPGAVSPVDRCKVIPKEDE